MLAKMNIASSSSNAHESSQERITLIVDGTRFSIETCEYKKDFFSHFLCLNKLSQFSALLTQHPNSMLGRMFSSGIEWQIPNERGEFEVILKIAE
jgi:BTB/POZ domain-containing protein 10